MAITFIVIFVNSRTQPGPEHCNMRADSADSAEADSTCWCLYKMTMQLLRHQAVQMYRYCHRYMHSTAGQDVFLSTAAGHGAMSRTSSTLHHGAMSRTSSTLHQAHNHSFSAANCNAINNTWKSTPQLNQGCHCKVLVFIESASCSLCYSI